MILLPNSVEHIKSLVGIFSILNPLGVIPIYLSLMANRSTKEMHLTALKTSIAVATILIISVWVGTTLLMFFGITIPAFRIAGGLLVLLIAIDMFHANPNTTKHTEAEHAEAEVKNDVSVVPLAIPLLAGPGAISLAIVDAHQAGNWTNKCILSLGIIGVAALIWIVLLMAEPIGKRLGASGLNITTRVMGLILAAMAVQFMSAGFLDIFPGFSH